jgi:hypothetical protein
MSATSDMPLDGFEKRLLTQLKAEVAARPVLADPITTRPRARVPHGRPRRRATGWRPPTVWRVRNVWRLPAVATAAVAALVIAALSILPAAAPALAQAFPILSERGSVLPARLVHALRAQWRHGVAPHFDLNHAYAFSTPAGTGYVVVDQRSRWLCILVPGFSASGASGRCEQFKLARLGEPNLSLRIGGGVRQEIVALLPRGAAASSATTGGQVSRLSLHRGVLAIASRTPVTILTRVGGRSASTTYTP